MLSDFAECNIYTMTFSRQPHSSVTFALVFSALTLFHHERMHFLLGLVIAERNLFLFLSSFIVYSQHRLATVNVLHRNALVGFRLAVLEKALELSQLVEGSSGARNNLASHCSSGCGVLSKSHGIDEQEKECCHKGKRMAASRNERHGVGM